jgi:hypothetical protein
MSEPKTPGLQTGDSGVHTPETLGLAPETPAQDFGLPFRGVSLVPVMGAETYPGISGRRLSWPGDSGLPGRRLHPRIT